uniref:Anaphase-promoting complex subunit 13 n=1 Tax=Equus caballus TaxID=9796 RepID=A0A3Q2IAI5_HORSE
MYTNGLLEYSSSLISGKLTCKEFAKLHNELPEPEQDNGGTTESVKEQEMKWTDLALQYLHENVPPTGN